MEHIKYFSDKLPHRHLGEPQENQAAEYIADQFKEAGLESSLIENRVLGWEIIGPPRLEVLEPVKKTVECAPFIYSSPTPKNGIEGELEYIGITTVIGAFKWKKYAIVESTTKKVLGYVVGRDIGPAIAQPVANAAVNWPSCIIGDEDVQLIEDFVKKGQKVRVKYSCQSQFKPNLPAYNVQGVLKGETEPDKIIIVSAHHDSQGALGFPQPIDSPGASDNASAVAAIIELARYFKQKKTSKTIYFISYCGEEWGLVGSKEYVDYLEERGILSKVVTCINLEEISKGIVLCCTDAEHERFPRINVASIVKDVYEELNLPSEIGTRWEIPLGCDSDHWPFYVKGKPIVYIHPELYMEYHRYKDKYPEVIDEKTWQRSFELTKKIIEKIDLAAI